MTKTKTIKITLSQSTQRIDKFLAGFYAERSRASWQKGIRNKEVLVNNKIVKPDYVLKEDDEVEILKTSPSPSLKRRGENEIPLIPFDKNGKAEIPEIEIIYEDDDVIVLNKPAGVLSQNAESSKNPSISDFLVKHCPEIKNVGEDEMRFGVVHRLDKDTSGVIITAKNNQAFEFLKDQFKNRKTQKIYTALVYGDIKPKKGEINFKIGRSKTNPNMQTAIDAKKKENIKSREALTIYKIIKAFSFSSPRCSLSAEDCDEKARDPLQSSAERLQRGEKDFKDYSLLEVSLKTGRMHQIRVHLKAIGYPIVGDQKYFFKKYKNKNPELNRQFLHAKELGITLPNGKKVRFKAKLPNDLENFLDKIKLGGISDSSI